MSTASRLAFLTLAVVGCGPTTPTGPAELSPPADRTGIESAVPFDLEAVRKEFKDDERAARGRWEGRWVTHTAKVAGVPDGNVLLQDETGDVLNCLYPRTTADRKNTSDALATRGGGDKPITVTGRVHYDRGFNGVYLKDCVFSLPKP